MARRAATTIKLDEKEIGRILIDSLRGQRDFYMGTNAEIAADDDVLVEEIDENTQLDRQHVDVGMQVLVAAQAHLKNKVGIFSPYSEEYISNAAMTLVGQRINTAKTRKIEEALSKIPLMQGGRNPAGLQGQALTDHQAEYNRREEQRAVLNNQLRAEKEKVIERQKLESFRIYLEAVSSQANMLGNPAKKSIKFDACEQLIIPIRDGQHYTVAVVQLSKGKKKSANIKYYDSMGSDLDDDLKEQLCQFFRNKGFEPEYENYAQSDQRDNYNCGVFACFGALDLLNFNANKTETYLENIRRSDNSVAETLADLSKADYDDHLNGLRQQLISKLVESGMRITLSGPYAEALEARVLEKSRNSAKPAASASNTTVTLANNFVDNVARSVNGISIQNTLLYGLLIAFGLYVTIPYIAVSLNYLLELHNPLVNLVLGAASFGGVLLGAQYVSEAFLGQNANAQPPQTPAQQPAQPTTEQNAQDASLDETVESMLNETPNEFTPSRKPRTRSRAANAGEMEAPKQRRRNRV